MAYMIKKGADVNAYFPIHKETLLRLKTNFLKCKNNFEKFKKRRSFNSNCLRIITEKLNQLGFEKDEREQKLQNCISK